MTQMELFGTSPFDQIKCVDEHGNDYWTGRQLMPLLTYEKWERFAEVVDRARMAIAESGGDPESEASRYREASGATNQQRWNYRFTRHGAYMVTLECDGRKPAVAAAKTYFAVTTERAERTLTAIPDITTPAGLLALTQMFQATAQQLVESDRKLHELEPKALAHDALLAADAGDVLVRQAAKVLGWKEHTLRALLEDENLIFRSQAPCGRTQWDFYAANAAHFNATKTVVRHTWGTCSHYTLYIRPQGLLLIQKRISDRKTDLTKAIETT